MFNLENEIRLWRINLVQSGINNPEVIDELESHLREEIERLIVTGVSESQAFEAARQQLGESASLKSEFSKLNRHWLWVYRDNPWQIKLLAAFCIVQGLNGVTSLFHVLSWGLHQINLLIILTLSASLLQLPMGIGLLRRQNRWRIYTLVWSALVFVVWTRAVIVNFPKWADARPNYYFIGISFPYEAMYIIGGISTMIMVWASYVLLRPTVRNLYRPAKAN